MEQTSYYVNVISLVSVVILWIAFAAIFLLRKKPATTPDKVGVSISFLGLALQGSGFGVIWAIRRVPLFSPVVEGRYILNTALQVLAVLSAASSVWLAMSAVRELGKQWSLQARLIEDHKLVKSGVYQLVRHPIYTAMLGMLFATGLAYSHWISLAAAVTVFLIGTRIRTSIEERLLADAFGPEFEEWKARVPGLVPFIKL